MNIKEHIDFLLKEYNLTNLYNNFITLSIITTLILRGFYWVLIIFSEIIKNKPELITKFSIILLILFSLNIPCQKILKDTTATFLKELRLANTKYFNNKIKNMNRTELLKFNLTEYYVTLDRFNDNIDDYIINNKNIYDIPFYCITLLIIAINKKDGLIILLLALFYIAVKIFNETKINDELPVIKELFEYDDHVRNYIINSKTFLINNELNTQHLINNINSYEESKLKIHKINNLLDCKTNIAILIFIIIIIYTKINNLDQYDFFFYFLIVYDIEYIADKITEFYKNKNTNKIQERLNYLNNIKCKIINNCNPNPINKIIIHKIKNDKPNVEINNIIIDGHILIRGASGSGKTSLLYILKGIILPDILDIEPNINDINDQTFISLPNYKNLFSDYLYNIITNYEKNPNIEMINNALKLSKINHILNENKYINIEKLSSGERLRLYIAQIIYTVKTKKYNILLFDELDENLNDEMALEICSNIKEIFKDNIILYISHNRTISKLFNKKITVDNGTFNMINQ